MLFHKAPAAYLQTPLQAYGAGPGCLMPPRQDAPSLAGPSCVRGCTALHLAGMRQAQPWNSSTGPVRPKRGTAGSTPSQVSAWYARLPPRSPVSVLGSAAMHVSTCACVQPEQAAALCTACRLTFACSYRHMQVSLTLGISESSLYLADRLDSNSPSRMWTPGTAQPIS